MDIQDLLMTAARGLGVYIVMLVVIRLLGKRTIGNFTAFDLLVALMLGEVVDEIIYGDVSIAQGAVAILVVAAAKYATAWLTYWSPRLSNILEGRPTQIVKNGELQHGGLRDEMMNDLEAYAALRLQSIRDMREVKSAMLEVDGQISIIREPWAEPLQKSDLEPSGSKKRSEEADEEEASPKHFTDTPWALGQVAR